jgi:hypothetical protein
MKCNTIGTYILVLICIVVSACSPTWRHLSHQTDPARKLHAALRVGDLTVVTTGIEACNILRAAGRLCWC